MYKIGALGNFEVDRIDRLISVEKSQAAQEIVLTLAGVPRNFLNFSGRDRCGTRFASWSF
jgi:hypothetical protein